MNGKRTYLALCAACCAVRLGFAEAVLPGDRTDPTAGKAASAKAERYEPPERLQYPYVSTYYVRPEVKADREVKIGFFVTDFYSSKIRFNDDSHRFSVFLEYRPKGGASKVVSQKDVPSGDGEFNLGVMPKGEYEMRLWAVDAKGRESHRVIHDFRVLPTSGWSIPSRKVYSMTEADLASYGIRNDGDVERIVHVDARGKSVVVREKRSDAPGYTVTVPLDAEGNVPVKACKLAAVVYDEGYDKAAAEESAIATTKGIQRLLDDKASAGFRKVVMLPGTYRLSWRGSVCVPSGMTLDLGTAVLKQNAFTGSNSVMVRLVDAVDSHLVGGTLEGDYWTHDYAGSADSSEWVSGFEIGGDTWYCSVSGVKVVDITGYGGRNGIAKDSGGLSFFRESLPEFAPGGIDAKTGKVDATDRFRFTTDFKSLKRITDEMGRRRLQVSRYLGYQGRATRSWQMTVAWYDAGRRFISAETSWQYREMWIPQGAAFLRVSVEAESAEAAAKSGLSLVAMRIPVNCVVRDCRFEHCRCVGYAAAAMKNMLFGRNFFTRSGESAARCAFDAEDGWDQMQDVYFLKNVFRDNPVNNSILTCAGHNFIMEKNDCDIYLWGRTNSPCVRSNAIGQATFRCDSRLRSGYGRFDGNTYSKGLRLGDGEEKYKTDDWFHVVPEKDTRKKGGRKK